MLLRAFCHAGGVKTVDDRFRGRGFSYGRTRGAARAVSTPTRSERRDLRPMPGVADAIRAFGDDGTLGLAVLPPDFSL